MIKKYSLVLIAFLCSLFYGFGQEIASFSSDNNIACSGIIASDINLTAVGICRGSGVNYKNGQNYNSRDWTTNPTIDSNEYLEWSITPNIGYVINLSTLDIGYSRSPQGPAMTEIQVDFGAGFITVFNDIAVNAGGENNTGIDLSVYPNIANTITFRLYAYNASHTNGTFTVEEHTITNKGIIINGTITPIPCSTTTTWNGSSWNNGIPNINTFVVIDGDYDTSISGSFGSCNLIINAGSKLNVRNSTYVNIQNNVVVDGELTIQTHGAFVQVDDTGIFTVNTGGTASVIKQTANLNQWYEYTYWSSPVTGETVEDAFPNTPTNRRFWYNAQNYLDETREVGNNNQTLNGQDDIDDNGNDWQIASGVMTEGLGYAATSSPLGMFPGIDQATFIGEFHTGDVDVTVYKNNLELADNNWNLIGNPYPSAISADAFLAANSVVNQNVSVIPSTGVSEGTLFLWSQNTTPSNSNNGNEILNFSQSDYAIINSSTQVAGGDGITPDRFIPSGQSFFIAYDNTAAGTLVSGTIYEGTINFTNSMRMADTTSNNLFFRGASEIDNKLWLNLTSDNGVFSQIAMAYVEEATHKDDGSAYDTERISSLPRAASIYSKINGKKEKGFAIQSKSPSNLTVNEIIRLGFKTDIDVPTLYKFSIPKLEGSFFETNIIYVKDRLLNKVHNLLDSDYTFTSEPGEFNKRFEIVFKSKSFEKKAENLNTINSLKIIEHYNGNIEFALNSTFNLKKITILDFKGKIIYTLNADGNSKVFNLSNLKQATYIAQVELSDGSIITKKLIKRK